MNKLIKNIIVVACLITASIKCYSQDNDTIRNLDNWNSIKTTVNKTIESTNLNTQNILGIQNLLIPLTGNTSTNTLIVERNGETYRLELQSIDTISTVQYRDYPESSTPPNIPDNEIGFYINSYSGELNLIRDVNGVQYYTPMSTIPF